MPAALQTAFALGLSRLASSGDPIQAAISRAGSDYRARGASSYMAAWWNLYADKGRLSLRLQYLHTIKEALADVERRLFEWTTDTEAGVGQSDSDVFKAVVAMRADVLTDINTLEKQIMAGRGAASGVMTTTRPGIRPGQSPYPLWANDPNDPAYRGDPLKRYPGYWYVVTGALPPNS